MATDVPGYLDNSMASTHALREQQREGSGPRGARGPPMRRATNIGGPFGRAASRPGPRGPRRAPLRGARHAWLCDRPARHSLVQCSEVGHFVSAFESAPRRSKQRIRHPTFARTAPHRGKGQPLASRDPASRVDAPRILHSGPICRRRGQSDPIYNQRGRHPAEIHTTELNQFRARGAPRVA